MKFQLWLCLNVGKFIYLNSSQLNMSTIILNKDDPMIGYATIGVNDIEKAKDFYCNLFDSKVQVDVGRIAMIGKTADKPMVAVCNPFNGESPSCGNGAMIAFPQESKAAVDAMHAKALSLGATDDGAPGQRIDDVFYGSYAKDADGNKLCFYIFG